MAPTRLQPIEKILKHLLDHYTGEEYSVNHLSRDIGMSRFQVYRHIRSVYGLSFSQLLITVRVLAGVGLLIRKQGNVSEVAYAVGFSNASYFIACYSSVFECSPGQTQKSGIFPPGGREKIKCLLEHKETGRLLREGDFFLPALESKNTSAKQEKKYLLPMIAVSLFFLLVVGLVFTVRNGKAEGSSEGSSIPGQLAAIGHKRRIVHPEEKVKLTVYPFRGPEEDTLNQWLKRGLPIGISEDLAQHRFINVRWKEVREMAEMVKFSDANGDHFFLSGEWNRKGTEYILTARLFSMEGKHEEVFFASGKGLFTAVDNLTKKVMDVLKAPNYEGYADLPVSEILTRDEKAFELYSMGICNQFPECFPTLQTCKNLMMAAEKDSTFALANYQYAKFCYYLTYAPAEQKVAIQRALAYRDRLPEKWNTLIVGLYHQIFQAPTNALEVFINEHKSDPSDYRMLDELGDLAIGSGFFPAAIGFLSQRVQYAPMLDKEILLAKLMMSENQFQEARELIEQLHARYGNKPELDDLRIDYFLLMGQLDSAKILIRRMTAEDPDAYKGLDYLNDHIRYMESGKVPSDQMEQYAGTYLRYWGEISRIKSVGRGLYLYGKNRSGHFYFPAGIDTLVRGAHQDGNRIIVERNNSKQINLLNTSDYYYKDEQLYLNLFPVLKIDTTVEKGLLFMSQNRKQEAFSQFYQALNNTLHPALISRYIQHLEYVLSDNYNPANFQQFMGRYYIGDYYWDIVEEDGELFEVTKDNKRTKLLPLNETEYIEWPNLLLRYFSFHNETTYCSTKVFYLPNGDEHVSCNFAYGIKSKPDL